MENSHKDALQEDLRYVKTAVARRGDYHWMPLPIAITWAIIVVIGMTLSDTVPVMLPPDAGMKLFPIYWGTANTIGIALSIFFGIRHCKRRGEQDKVADRTESLHWIGLGIAVCVLYMFAYVKPGMPWLSSWHGYHLGQGCLVVGGLAYWMFGVHMDRKLIWVGVALFAGAILTHFVYPGSFTLAGVLMAIGLLAPAISRRRAERAQARAPANA